ncbi:MAG: NAD-dependent epimerase/dehydratase family protein [Deltaproteobacteria bacterium]|nr:NAD-dependent epimerase/dehydratase family protein [Candidatus Zymogenaceae bacterium]
MKRALITGALGLAGVYLARHLIEKGYRVFGMDVRDGRDDDLVPEGLKIITGDITNPSDVIESFKISSPHLVFHLGAMISGGGAAGGSADFLDCNVKGTLHVLETALAQNKKSRILFSSSSAVYDAGIRKTVAEDSPLGPVTFYGVTKLLSEQLCTYFAGKYDQEIVIARTFNNTAPGEHTRMVSSSLAVQVARMEGGEAPPLLKVGRTDIVRDFTDTRDVVRAYFGLIEKGERGGIYNVCSGTGRPIACIIDVLREASSISFDVETESGRERNAKEDISSQIGDPSKLTARTGWKTNIPFEQTIRELLDYWRRNVSRS